MTYKARGRSLFELVVAVTFAGFLVGFVTVLCVGNYIRAKRAMERQRARRLEKQILEKNTSMTSERSYSPYNSSHTSSMAHWDSTNINNNGSERTYLLGGGISQRPRGGKPNTTTAPHNFLTEDTDSLLLHEETPTNHVSLNLASNNNINQQFNQLPKINSMGSDIMSV